jgi:hypothetical protein
VYLAKGGGWRTNQSTSEEVNLRGQFSPPALRIAITDAIRGPAAADEDALGHRSEAGQTL